MRRPIHEAAGADGSPSRREVLGASAVLGPGHWTQHEATDRLNAELIKFLGTVGSPPER